jgi:hypothetical protein
MGWAQPACFDRKGRAVSALRRQTVRPPAVAGSFYPRDLDELTAVVDTLLQRDRLRALDADAASAPVALVVPHAGYVYSGPVATSAYDVCPSVGRSMVIHGDPWLHLASYPPGPDPVGGHPETYRGGRSP